MGRGHLTKGDCERLLHYLERCIATQPSVGRAIRTAGQVSFEDRIEVVRRIFNEP